MLVVGSVVLKSALQAGSHWLPQIAMEGGVHYWVIAFLHLIFLGVVSPYLIYELVITRLLPNSKLVVFGTSVLLIGIVGSEFILGLQGAAAYVSIPFSSEFFKLVQGFSFVLWLSTAILLASSFQKVHNDQDPEIT